MLSIQDITASYDETIILDRLSLTVQPHDIVSLIGPSGAGKSTLMNCITSLHPIDNGEILLNGQTISPKAQTIGWIPQHYGLLPWKSVYDNIMMGLTIKKIPLSKTLIEKTTDIIQELGLTDLLQQFPNQLSGGQQQRVSIARSMVMSPDLFLLDEPFSALDAITREKMQHLFLNQWQQHQAPTILITHDVEEAVFLGRRIVLLSGKPGQIIHEFDNPSFEIEPQKKRLTDSFYHVTKRIREALD